MALEPLFVAGTLYFVVVRVVVLQIVGCTDGHARTKLGPSISPWQEVANKGPMSRRATSFWDQFRGAGSGVSFRSFAPSLLWPFSSLALPLL
jgi:hypothetical protein